MIDDNRELLDWVCRHMLNVITVHSARQQYRRMSRLAFEPTIEWALENDANIAALVTTYGRLFNEGHGSTRYKADWLPPDLRDAHDEIMSLRHERYAHNGGHDSLTMSMHVTVGEASVHLRPQIEMGFYVNGANSWGPLFEWWENKGMEIISGRLRSVSDSTGVTWQLEQGPPPADTE